MTRSEWAKLFTDLTFVDADQNEVAAYDHRSGAHEVVVPRGALDMIPKHVERVDMRSRPLMPKLQHVKELDANGYTGQDDAVVSMYEHEQGQLRLPTAWGKTTMALSFIANCKTRTLVLVHTQDLLTQWVERAEEEIPGIDVGVVQGSTCDVGHLTVATMQTMRKRYLRAGGKFWRQFGCVMIDESHHAGAEGYSWLLSVCPAYYRFGLSASSKRSDGWQPMVRYNLGPVIHSAPFKPQVELSVVPVFSEFTSRYNAMRWTSLVKDLVNDEERNDLVAEVVAKCAEDGLCTLVLSRQIKHLELIADALDDKIGCEYAIVTGQSAYRREAREAMRDGSLKVVLGTQIFEEGVDVPSIDRIVLAFPGTDITTLQKVGRGARAAEGKQECVVYDIVDRRVAALARQWLQRRDFYKANSITIQKKGDQDVATQEEGRKLLIA